MKSRGVLAIVAAFVAGIAAQSRHVFARGNGRAPKITHHHGRGKGGQPGCAGAPGSKLWHRLTSGHSLAAGWPGRRVRQYAARGYGYVAPSNAPAAEPEKRRPFGRKVVA